MSGTLHHLGLFVPGPHFGANESNPKGFFESRWAVKFHKTLEAAAGINDFDSRPEAVDRAREAVTPKMREQLATFLGKHVADHPQVVVKDPRSVWAQGLWRDAARDAGMEIRYISMLRHPAEVVGSRATYYAGQRDEEQRRRYVTISVARWINGSIISERETRGQARAFVRYNDLLEDWRPVLARLRDELGLTYDGDLATGVPSPVDDFIDPDLRRHQVTWDELEVPTELRDVAQQVWEDVSALGDAGGRRRRLGRPRRAGRALRTTLRGLRRHRPRRPRDRAHRRQAAGRRREADGAEEHAEAQAGLAPAAACLGRGDARRPGRRPGTCSRSSPDGRSARSAARARPRAAVGQTLFHADRSRPSHSASRSFHGWKCSTIRALVSMGSGG